MTALANTSDFVEILQRVQDDRRDIDMALELDVPRGTYTMVKHGKRYPNERFIAGMLSAFPDHTEEILAAYGQIPPAAARRRRGEIAISSRESEFQRSIVGMIKAGRGREALAGIDRALQESSTPTNRLWLLDQRADLAFASGEFESGIASWEGALTLAIETERAKDEVELRLRLASRLMNEELYERAQKVLYDGLARDPSAGRLWRRKGICYWHEHEYAAAYASLVTAKVNGVSAEKLLYARGQVLAEWGAYEAAIAELSAALRQALPAQRAAYVRTTRAFAYGQLGKTRRALREFAIAERVTPENAWLYYFRGCCYEVMGMVDECAAQFERALELEVPRLNAKKREQAQTYLTTVART